MICIGTEQSWKRTRRSATAPTGQFFKGEWMETDGDHDISPTVFLVEMPPKLVANPHFHKHNQFQVFLKGSGSIGPHELRPVAVHYAGAYTGYGPVLASDEGLWYFTMRPAFETGAFYLPESRREVIRGPKRHAMAQLASVATLAQLRSLGEPYGNDLIPLAQDELAARDILLPPGERAHGLDPTGTGGQFFIVLAGSMVFGGSVLRPWEHVFVSADEQPFTVTAGEDGLHVLFLQFPELAPEYAAHAGVEPRTAA